MNRESRQRQRRHLPAILLICFLAALNASQGMVWCVAAHGHVAIEPLAHRHCDSTTHHHEHGANAEPSHDHDSGYTAQERCRPCVDIPLTLGPLDEKAPFSPANAAVALAIGEPSAPLRNPDASPDASDRTLLPSQQTALRSVVLQV